MNMISNVVLELKKLQAIAAFKELSRSPSSEGTARVNRLLVNCLKSYSVPADLLEMIAQQLRVKDVVRDAVHKARELEVACVACAIVPRLSNGRLAVGCRVSKPTIARWRANRGFELSRRVFQGILSAAGKSERKRMIKDMGSPWLAQLLSERSVE